MSDEKKAPTLGDKIRSFAKDGRMLGLSDARIGWLEELAKEADELDALVARDAHGNAIRPGDVVRRTDGSCACKVSMVALSKHPYVTGGLTSIFCEECEVMVPKTD